MRVIILGSKLKEAVNVVSRISIKSISLPILQNVLIVSEKNFLKLSSTDLETGITFWALSKTEKEGKICVPLSIFSKLISFFPETPLNLEGKDFILNIESEVFSIKIKGTNPEDFPIIPQINQKDYINVNCEKFCEALSQIYDIPSGLISKPEISGVFLLFHPEFLKLVATDSFRLFERTIFLKTNIQKEISFILPQKAAKEIISIFGQKEGELRFYFSPNQIWIETLNEELSHPKIQFTSRLIEGEYPNYQEVIPKKFETEVVFLKDEFLEKLRTASLFSGKNNEVKLIIIPKEKKIEIESQSPDLGEYKSFINGEIKGEELTISFNHRFLTKGIS